MNTDERPKPAAELIVGGFLLGVVAFALLAWGASVEPVPSYSDDPGPVVWTVFGALVGVGSVLCSAVGVFRLVGHADRAALLAYERREQGSA